MRVLVFGHFRAVHLGHLRLFEYAKSLGGALFVAINTMDKSQSDISFSESVIKSFPFTLNIVKYSNLEDKSESSFKFPNFWAKKSKWLD
jgi:cytidyltransferase-like protein